MKILISLVAILLMFASFTQAQDLGSIVLWGCTDAGNDGDCDDSDRRIFPNITDPNTYVQWDTTGDALSFFTGGNRAMTIDASQRVGIGDAIPGAQLDIVSSAAGTIPTGQRERCSCRNDRKRDRDSRCKFYSSSAWRSSVLPRACI